MCLSSLGVTRVAFKPDNLNILVSCSNDKTIKMWDITSGSCLSTLRGHSDWVGGVAFNPRDPQMLVSCSDDKTIKVWNITSGACLSTLRGHRYVPSLSRECFLSCFCTDLVCLSSRAVNCVAFKPDNPNILVSGSHDETIKMWDITSGSILSTLRVDAGDYGVQCVTFNGTGDTIVAGCYNGNIFFIDTSTNQVREPPLRGHRYAPSLSREYFLSCFQH